jgi:hypothetical protein
MFEVQCADCETWEMLQAWQENDWVCTTCGEGQAADFLNVRTPEAE